ncbi:MAG: (2Fe-2S)-binding protein [Deltaproteobacteria bacterium]|nr:(2Fe-2S)-binding protein [Deltaproteobacteria bacterium]
MSKTQNRSLIKLIDAFGVEHHLAATAGKTILDIAVENSVEMAHSCGGMGSCGTCRIRLHADLGAIPAMEEVEEEMAIDRGFLPDERLSCQIEIPSGGVNWTAEALGGPKEEEPF